MRDQEHQADFYRPSETTERERGGCGVKGGGGVAALITHFFLNTPSRSRKMCCCQKTATVCVLVTGHAGDRRGSADLGPHVGPGPDPDGPAFHICWHLVVKLRFTPSLLEMSGELKMKNGFFHNNRRILGGGLC